MSGAHADRAHATWSASASERRWACAGSLAAEAEFPHDKESQAAAWGTAAHEVAERALRSGGDTSASLGDVVRTKSHEIAVDDEVCETAQVFVDYVRSRQTLDSDLLVEQKFSLDAIRPPFDAGGTGDAVILDPSSGTVEIVDLKGGRGIVVEATGNKQLRTYALGAMLANPGKWRTIRATIVQPRAPHRDGAIRSEEFHVADLMDWTSDLIDAMRRSNEALRERSRTPPDEWARRYLKAGDHCTFCKTAATCPALAERALAEAHVFFDGPVVSVPPAPEDLTIGQTVRVLDAADMIQNWLNAVRAHAQDLAERGVEVSDGASTYVLSPKRAIRKWAEGIEATGLALATGRDEADFFQEPKLMSPAQVEKLLGKKGFADVASLVTKESSGYNLVRSDKTTRAVAGPAQDFFQKQDGKD